MKSSYNRINNISGWIVFAIASIVYIMTAEPTASFWDCGEYIATAYKLQVGHPPGAPFFQIVGRFFSLFAGNNPSMVARMVNIMSALVSGFTILFLFWSITHMAKKLIDKTKEFSQANLIAVIGSGAVGALAFTFSDSFWFSAVEGEVYAFSTFFTAIVFWAILKWERVADELDAYKWIILIAYLIGLSIGVHLLNLLAIPAIIFVFYFRKYKPSTKGIILTAAISFVVLALMLWVLIPWVVSFAGLFERFFVNTIGLPFNSGTFIYFLLLVSGIVWGLMWTRKKGRVTLNTAILSFVFILIGYSSFFLLVVRSNANPPIDENNPENAISLLAYLNREQYGDWPVFKGAYYNAPIIDQEDGKPTYSKDEESGKYVITDAKKNREPVYDPRFVSIFPRMWSTQRSIHPSAYKDWAHSNRKNPVSIRTQDGKTETRYVPSFGENMTFFFKYQIGHMYLRYFMWNFAGRQNDIQGHGGPLHGNWISGINALDSKRLGPQKDLPFDLKQNKANNKFFLLPLILGLIGLVFQFNKDYKDGIIVSLLFLMTGFAIIIYLNQYPYQPRERDYAYAASFMAFSIWIGLGVMSIFQAISKKKESVIAAAGISLACLVLVPGIMASEGWDDHNRAKRYTALAIAKNYLESCKPNAVLFTNGDNDTFPLWYAQEVEGIRTDVRVVNLSLLNTDWYVDQMSRKAYDSDPVPFTLTPEQVRQGTRDVVYIVENDRVVNTKQPYELGKLIREWVASDDPRTRLQGFDYLPTKYFRIPVDKEMVIANDMVPEYLHDQILDNLDWKLNERLIQKNNLMLLDFLSTNNWERPIYFAITTGADAYIDLTDFFQLEGFTYRLLPVKNPPRQDGQIGRMDTDIMYDNLMNKFEWGNMGDPNVYLDETNMRMVYNMRNNYGRLAKQLAEEGKKEKAMEVIDRLATNLPNEAVAYDFYMLPIVETYMSLGEEEQAETLIKTLLNNYNGKISYLESFDRKFSSSLQNESYQTLAMTQRIVQIGIEFAQQLQASGKKENASEMLNLAYDVSDNGLNFSFLSGSLAGTRGDQLRNQSLGLVRQVSFAADSLQSEELKTKAEDLFNKYVANLQK